MRSKRPVDECAQRANEQMRAERSRSHLEGRPVSVLSRLLPGSGASLSIEPMSRRHLREILAIEHAAYPKPWTRSVFESELAQVARGGRHYVVARQGRRLAGYAGLWFVDDPDGAQAHVTNIVVAPDVRRQGVGLRLMCELAAVARRRRCVAWTLEVRASNTGAQELYRRFGFVPAGVRRRYYENSEDAIVMWCHDLGSDDYAERLDSLTGEVRR
jgi:ribosomal-protein-alanine N-acetyltransferase